MRSRTYRLLATVAVVLATWAGAPELQAQDWQTVAVSRQPSDEEQLDATVQHALGTLRLAPTGASQLYTMQLRYDAELFEPVTTHRGSAITLGMHGRGSTFRRTGERGSPELEVGLSPALPLALHLDFGAGRAEVELGGLQLTDLALRTGASETLVEVSRPNPLRLAEASFAVGAAQFEGRRLANLNADRITVEAGVGAVVLDLTGEWRGDLHLAVEMGLGSLEVRVPRGVGVKLVKQSLLTDLDAPGLDRRGGEWYSADWGTTARELTVEVEAAFGSIRIRWIDGA